MLFEEQQPRFIQGVHEMKKNQLIAVAFTLIAAILSFTSQARAETIFGGTAASSVGANPLIDLVSFDSATPGTVTTIGPFTGMIAGHTVRTLDFRPFNGILYAISANATNNVGQLYTVNTSTAVMTPVGGTFSLGTNTDARIDMDFNPSVDRIRVVTGGTGTSGLNNNFRVNPNDGTLVATDTNLAFDPTDPNNGFGDFNIIGIAYSPNTPGVASTTLFAWDYAADELLRIGSVGGTPTSPNSGSMFTINVPAGFITTNSGLSMDVSGASGTCFVSKDSGSSAQMGLYTRNLSTGAVALINNYPAGVAIPAISVRPAVTASGVTISGRVNAPGEKRGLRNAIVTLTDAQGVTRSTVTGIGGLYTFNDVETGGSYVISVRSRTYDYSPRVVQVFDSLSDIDFFAN